MAMAIASPSTSAIWFPVNESQSSSWPPKINFCHTPARAKTARSPHAPKPDAMDIVGLTRSTHARAASRAIPNRPSRSKSLSVPATPTDLWQPVLDLKGKARDSPLTRGLPMFGVDKCPRSPAASGRIRPSSLAELCEPGAWPLPPSVAIRCSASASPRPPAPTPPSLRSGSAPLGVLSICPQQPVLPQWDHAERAFLRLWSKQKRHNPHLSVVPSRFNPLRNAMPPMYWRSFDPNHGQTRVEWNYERPLPSPALQTKLRSRK
ncbi:hypothetical protein GGX14DRAFT_433840 [Mycena pura]|uniref:Uncharacterized protein n=1 Tax=Mycena pura TaxID=153505 RepID=A0AAD6YJU7_9AGAR|nr:hypothetical protein GGX14DRAFT_433840 [Mycena pura]